MDLEQTLQTHKIDFKNRLTLEQTKTGPLNRMVQVLGEKFNASVECNTKTIGEFLTYNPKEDKVSANMEKTEITGKFIDLTKEDDEEELGRFNTYSLSLNGEIDGLIITTTQQIYHTIEQALKKYSK